MPKRTNTFQQVVAVIHDHMADGATVEESAMVTPIRGGPPREVDVLVTSTVAGHEIRVAVEACRRTRRADTPWVESMIGKHQDLPTHRLVLYSDSGFSAPALSKAAEHDIAAISAEPLSNDELEKRVIGGLRSIWPKVLTLTPDSAKVWVRRPDGVVWFKAAPDLRLFFEDGNEFHFDLRRSVIEKLRAQMLQVFEQIDVANISESMERNFQVVWKPFSVIIDGVERRLHARFEESDPPELHPIEIVETTGAAKIEVQQVELKHARLGQVLVAYGDVSLMGQPGVLVASDAAGEELLTIRLRGSVETTGALAKPSKPPAEA